ncbi:MAG: carboxymuconolactone decarboxylase family protein [Actinomycetota bacterium]|nr:carboxymuconolactone decarboxylase family protein [Actinomycetota bacterium]
MDNDGDETASTFDRGAAMMRRVYGDAVPTPPEGAMAFSDVMIRSLFAEVWDRDVLSIRDRRLLILGVIAACGAADVWSLQVRAALDNDEFTPEELRETLVLLAPYAGYPRVAPLVGASEEAINAWQEISGGGADV